MTLYEFNALGKKEQGDAAWDGVLISDRSDDTYNILLYQIDSFYVEVYIISSWLLPILAGGEKIF